MLDFNNIQDSEKVCESSSNRGAIYMKKYQNIIVFINEEINSNQILEQTIAMATAFETTITLVYIVNIASVISKFHQCSNIEEIEFDINKQGEEMLKKFSEIIPQYIKVKGVIKVGSLSSVILSFAKKYNDVFIIIDNQIFGLPRKICISNYSRYVITHSDCTILIVK